MVFQRHRNKAKFENRRYREQRFFIFEKHNRKYKTLIRPFKKKKKIKIADAFVIKKANKTGTYI